MKVRKLNEKGLHAFSAFIENIRSGGTENIPNYLLDNPETSENIPDNLEVEKINFNSRYEMGLYLIKMFGDTNLQGYIGDSGFWSWFSLLWIDQLCPIKNDGTRKVSMPYNYILSKNFYHRPRHAIYMTWQLVNRYGEHSRFLLSKEISTRGEITEQLMGRQEVLSSEGVMQLASELYFDTHSGIFKKGAASRTGAGCVFRYISWLQQLQLTFDIFSTSKDDLADLLPHEFNKFR